MSKLASVSSTVGFDLQIPADHPATGQWGNVQLYVDLPSRGIYNQSIGQRELFGSLIGQYVRLEYTLPAAVKTALQGTYTDLRFRIVISSVPATGGAYLLDRFTLSHENTNPGPGGENPVDVGRVLGLEEPGDWKLNAGALTQVPALTEGAQALKLPSATWLVLESRRLPTVGPLSSSQVSVDVQVPSSSPNPTWWGSLTLAVDLPSKGLWGVWIGSFQFGPTQAGSVKRITFTFPDNVRNALNSSYSDLAFRLSFSLPSGTGLYTVDRLRLDRPIGPTTGTEYLVHIPLSREALFGDVVVGPAELDGGTSLGLNIGRNTRVFGKLSGYGAVFHNSPNRWDLGDQSEVGASFSLTDVVLGQNAIVHGDLLTSGLAALSTGSQVTGAIYGKVPLIPDVAAHWTVTFPVASTSQKLTLALNEQKTITPAYYDGIWVGGGAKLTFQPGDYYFDTLVVANNGTLRFNNAGNGVRLFISRYVDFQGSVEYQTSSKNNITLMNLGTGGTVLGKSLQALVVAPRSELQLRGAAPFYGAFFGSRVRLLDNVVIYHRPLDPGGSCDPASKECSVACPCDPGGDCNTNADCGAGQICSDCSTPGRQCGQCVCPTSCEGKQCGDDLADGCGGVCTGVCDEDDPCVVDTECQPGLVCLAGQCKDDICLYQDPRDLDCGVADADCGTCPVCVPECGNRRCGGDGCGGDCGSCGGGEVCYPQGFCGPLVVNPDPEVVTTGTGALAGSFAVGDSGAATYSIPIDVPPGRQDFQPQVSLSYSSTKELSVLAPGWQLEGFSQIARCQRTVATHGVSEPVNYVDDVFCLDDEPLVLVNPGETYGGEGVGYTTERSPFVLVRSYGRAATGGPEYFKAWSRDGSVRSYGSTEDSVALAYDVKRVWALATATDASGNTISFSYRTDAVWKARDGGACVPQCRPGQECGHDGCGGQCGDGCAAGDVCRTSGVCVPKNDPLAPLPPVPVVGQTQTRQSAAMGSAGWTTVEMVPEKISYGGSERQTTLLADRSVEFFYDLRPKTSANWRTSYTAGVEARNARELKRIETHARGQTLRIYHIEYEDIAFYAPIRHRRVARIRECAAGGQETCKAPTEFSYYDEQGFGLLQNLNIPVLPGLIGTDVYGRALVLNADGDTYDDLAMSVSWPGHLFRGKISGVIHQQVSPPAFNYHGMLMDFDRDGIDDPSGLRTEFNQLSGQVKFHGTGWGDGPGWAEDGSALPADVARVDVNHYLADLDGDSYTDFITCAEGSAREHLWISLGLKQGGFDSARELAEDPYGYCHRGWGALLLDVDGDGDMELLRGAPWKALHLEKNGGNLSMRTVLVEGLTASTAEGAVSLPWQYDGRDVRLLDFNGDGLTDIISIDPSVNMGSPRELRVWQNLGGRFELRSVKFENESGPLHLTPLEFGAGSILDYDGDGRQDFLYPALPDPLQFRILYGSARGMRGTVTRDNVGPWLRDDLSGLPLTPILADLNGDGNQDLVRPLLTGLAVHYGSGQKAHLLKSVVDGVGNQVEIFYDSQNDATGGPTYSSSFGSPACKDGTAACQTRAPSLVSKTIARQLYRLPSGGNSPNGKLLQTARYTYEGLRNGVGGRGSFGFGGRVVTVFDDQNRLVSTNSYTYENTDFLKAGLVKRVLSVTADIGDSVSRSSRRAVETQNDYVVKDFAVGRGRYPQIQARRTYVSDQMNESIEGPADYKNYPLWNVFEIFDDYSRFGNIEHHETHLQIAERDKPDLPLADSVTDTVFDHSQARTERWLLALPVQKTVASSRQGDSRTQVTAFTYTVDGLLESTTRDSTDASLYHKTVATRNDLGNVIALEEQVTDPSKARVTEISAYDAQQIFPTTVVNALGHASVFEYDTARGLLTKVTDPNGDVTRHGYDLFGRHKYTRAPEGIVETSYDRPSALFDAQTALQRLVITTVARGGATTRVFLDGHGLELASETTGFAGAKVLTEHSYDWADRPLSSSNPHVPGDQTQGTETFYYDLRGRLIQKAYPDNTHVNQVYATRNTLILAAGNPFAALAGAFQDWKATELTAVAKRADTAAVVHEHASVTDPASNTLVAVDAAGSYSSYVYGALNLPLTVRQAADSTQTTVDYDDYGRLIYQLQPDTGEHRYTYNAFDELEHYSYLDPFVAPNIALRQDVFRSYDALGRITSRSDGDGSTSWEYDNSGEAVSGAAAKELGKLVKATSPNGHITRIGYNHTQVFAPGLPDILQQEVDGEIFETQLVYDLHSRVRDVHYPDAGAGAFRLRHQFDPTSGSLMEIDDLDSGKQYWKLAAADQGYRLKEELFSNGNVASSRAYEPTTGRLSSIVTSTPTLSVQALGYLYDVEGRLRRREDTARGSSEVAEYGYDSLHRLKTVTRSVNGTFTPVGGLSVSYDALGNITYKSDVGAYEYNAFSLRRQAVMSAGSNVYQYNGKGNQTWRSGPQVAKGFQEIEYTAFDLPKLIHTGAGSEAFDTQLEYDADQSRIIKRDPNATTIYINGHYERTRRGDNTEEHKYKIFAGNRQVAQVLKTITPSPSGPPTLATIESYLHADALGSVTAITDSSGTLVHRQEFDAFGTNPLGTYTENGTASFANRVQAGFTGHTDEPELGLIDMRGRFYDPALGRFMTADPIVPHPLFSQSHNRYSYVLNSPLNFIDPSGFQDREAEGAGSPGSAGGGSLVEGSKPGDQAATSGGGNPRVLGVTMTGGTANGGHEGAKAGAKAKGPGVGPGPSSKGDGGPSGPGAPSGANPEAGKAGSGGGGARNDGGGGSRVEARGFAPGLPIVPIVRTAASASPAARVGMWFGPLGAFLAILLTDSNAGQPRVSEEGGVITPLDAATDVGGGGRKSPPRSPTSEAGEDEGGGGCPGCPCFLPGTLIRMADGTTKPIEEVQIGDWVLADDPEDALPAGAFRVVAVSQSSTERVINIDLFDATGKTERIEATGEHPFWVIGQGWVAAKDVTALDWLLDESAQSVDVAFVAVESRGTPTYNFTVEGTHTYFVVAGETSVLVHNQTPLAAPGYWNYVLKDGTGTVYYSGMSGSKSDFEVIGRHTRSGRLTATDRYVRLPGQRTYGEARVLEHELAVRHGTYTGRGGPMRGNRQNPIGPKNASKYFPNGGYQSCP